MASAPPDNPLLVPHNTSDAFVNVVLGLGDLAMDTTLGALRLGDNATLGGRVFADATTISGIVVANVQPLVDQAQASATAAGVTAATLSTALQSQSDNQIVGIPATPGVTGSNASKLTRAIATPAAQAGQVTSVFGFNPQVASATFPLKILSKSGNTFTEVGTDVAVTVPPGAFDVTLPTPIPIAAGQFVGFHPGGSSGSSADSALTFTGPSGLSYYENSVTGNVSSFTSSTPNSGITVQLGVRINYLAVNTSRVKAIESTANSAKVEADTTATALTGVAVVGRPANSTVNGTIVDTQSYFFATGAPSAGIIKRVRGNNPQTTSKTMYLRQATAAGAITGVNIPIVVPSGAFNLDLVLDCGLASYPTIAAGNLPGFHPGAATAGAKLTDNVVTYISGPADSGGMYNNGQSSPTSTVGFTPGSPATGNQFQIGFDIEYIAVTDARIRVIETALANSTSLTPLGGFYAAGDSLTYGAELPSPTTQRWDVLLATMLGKPITSWGTSGARTDEIVMRAGGLNAVGTVAGGVIPAGGGSVNLTGLSIQPLRGAGSTSADQLTLVVDLRLFDGTKVRGTISRVTPTPSDTDVVFTRSSSGAAISVTSLVEIIPFTPQASWNGIMFLGAGRNDLGLIASGTRSMDDIFAWYRAQSETMRAHGGRLLPWGTLDAGMSEAPGTAMGNRIAQLEAWLDSEFGVFNIPSRKYLASSRSLADAAIIQPGFTPTSNDYAAVAAGIVPPSYQSTQTTPDVHLNVLGHQLDARFKYRWITRPQVASALGLVF